MVTFRVPDMTCGHCAGIIAKAIAAEDASARVQFDIPRQLVHVTSAITPAQVESTIREAGYAPAAVQAQPARSGGCGCGCGTSERRDVARSQASAKGGCCV